VKEQPDTKRNVCAPFSFHLILVGLDLAEFRSAAQGQDLNTSDSPLTSANGLMDVCCYRSNDPDY
jgi:hypothetical protein